VLEEGRNSFVELLQAEGLKLEDMVLQASRWSA
jgi:hypothetical protein